MSEDPAERPQTARAVLIEVEALQHKHPWNRARAEAYWVELNRKRRIRSHAPHANVA
jgi:hypothetical protein